VNDLLALTADLIDRPSVSFEEAEFVDWIEAEFKKLEYLEVTRIGDNVVARTNLGRDKRMILAGHCDTVVPVNGNEKSRIDGDIVWGLGSADMKSGLAVFMELARNVREPLIDLSYVFYSREEVANRYSGLIELIAERPDLLEADCAILGEPTAASLEAGCQGTLRFEITLWGARAHTARPWMGRNAIHRLAPVLFELEAFKVRTPTIDGCTFCESIQAVHIEGGVAGNVVPEHAVVRVHYRYAPDRSPSQAEAFVNELLAPYLEPKDTVKIVDGSPACLPQMDHPLFRRLADENNLDVKAKLGWTDVARFTGLGVPAVNFGPGDSLVSHSADENCDRESLERTYHSLHKLITTEG